MIDNFSRDELLNDVDMTVVDGVESPAIKPYAQCELLIEAKYNVQEKGKDSEGDESKGIWRHWKMAGCFTES